MNKSLLLKGSLTGGLQSVVQILLVFSAIPIFIKLLGSEAYGIFSLVISLGNLNTFTNLGLGASLVKHLSEQGKGRESDFDIIVSFLLIFIVLLAVSGFVIPFNKVILLKIMKIPTAKYLTSKWFFICTVCSHCFLGLGLIFKSVLDAAGKVYLTYYLQMAYGILYWGFMITALLFGGNLVWVGGAILTAGIIWFMLILYNALNTWGIPSYKGLKINFSRVSRKELSYGGKIFSGGLVAFFYEPFLRLLISNFIGINEVGYFDIGIRIKNQLWGFVSRILYPLYPFIAQIEDNKKIGFLIQNIEQKVLYIAAPFVILFCFTIKPFVNIWLGHNSLIISQSAAVIVSTFLIGSCVTPFYYFLMSKNHPEKTVVLQTCNAFVSSLLFILTFKWAGYYAALIGIAGGLLSSFMVSLYYQQKYLQKNLIGIHKLLKLLLTCAVNVFVCYWAYIMVPGNLYKLFIIPVAVCCVTLLMYNRLYFFSQEDIGWYFGTSNKFSRYFAQILCRI